MTCPSRFSDVETPVRPAANWVFRARRASGAASIVLVLAAAVARAAPGQASLDIKAAPFGMSLAAWKASPFPGKASSGVEPVCSDRPGAATLLSTSAGASPDSVSAGASPDSVVCGYFGRYGRFLLPESLAVAPRLTTTQARYRFVAGRLRGIEYRFSVNAFDDLTARLNKLYGAPLSVARDTIKTEAGGYPRVRLIWAAPQGRIELTDPVAPYTKLGVRLTGATEPAHSRAS